MDASSLEMSMIQRVWKIVLKRALHCIFVFRPSPICDSPTHCHVTFISLWLQFCTSQVTLASLPKWTSFTLHTRPMFTPNWPNFRKFLFFRFSFLATRQCSPCLSQCHLSKMLCTRYKSLPSSKPSCRLASTCCQTYRNRSPPSCQMQTSKSASQTNLCITLTRIWRLSIS